MKPLLTAALAVLALLAACDDLATLSVREGTSPDPALPTVNIAPAKGWRAGTGAHRVFASGLRNPVGMAWDTPGQTLWTVVNERDELGSDLVPDYLTSVQDSAFYGGPCSDYGQTLDTRVPPSQPALVAAALKPDYAPARNNLARLQAVRAAGPPR